MTDPRDNPIVLQLVLDSLASETIPDLTTYPCSQEQFLAIRNEMLVLLVPTQKNDSSEPILNAPW